MQVILGLSYVKKLIPNGQLISFQSIINLILTKRNLGLKIVEVWYHILEVSFSSYYFIPLYLNIKKIKEVSKQVQPEFGVENLKNQDWQCQDLWAIKNLMILESFLILMLLRPNSKKKTNLLSLLVMVFGNLFPMNRYLLNFIKFHK